MRLHVKFVVAITFAGISCAACVPKIEKPRSPPMASLKQGKFLGDDSFTVQPCAGVPIPTRAYVFRIRKADIFNGPSPTGDQFVHKPTNPAGTDEETGDLHLKAVVFAPKPTRGTPFDVNLEIAPGDSVLIKIHLKNHANRLSFRPNDVATGKVRAITAGDAEGDTMLCDAKLISPTVATVRAWNSTLNPATYGSYNINIDVTGHAGGLLLPITIDPNIKNNG